MPLKYIKKVSPPLHLKSCAFVLGLLLMAVPAAAQHGSGRGAGEPLGAPGEALFPQLDALQRRAEELGWLIHGQATFIEQGHPPFHSPYRGENSLQPKAMQANTFSADLILGRRLWQGAEIIFDPQVIRGFGLSGTRGVAAFPNGEAFRIGSETPAAFVPRIFFRQTIGLSGDMVVQEDDAMHFAGLVARERITITAGKFAVFDIFDDNRYAHDPRTQFLNWAFVSAAAFDWANDAKGFVNGIALEWENGGWGVRAGAFQVARRINSLSLDPQPGRGHQLLLQFDRFFEINGRPGAVRLAGGYSRTRSSSWNDLVANDIEATLVQPQGRYAVKRMAVLNAEQEVAEGIGLFLRLSWNDGKTQNWMYTEMDRAASAGVSVNGGRWGRGGDTVGLAANVGGLSPSHRRFLEAGGIGFITGDGRLRYRPEVAVETYYDMHVAYGLHIAGDIQLIVNPAYNADRGPVALFALRLRSAF
jgi:high affinity Mn2+ porin